MSSGPNGLDAREYVYGVFNYLAADGLTHTIDAHNDWLVTRVQYVADPAVAAVIALSPSSPINVAAGGCLTLEPNGAFRDVIQVQGNGSLVIIEFWFQSIAGEFVATLPITVTP